MASPGISADGSTFSALWDAFGSNWYTGWSSDFFGKRSSRDSAEVNLWNSILLGDYNRRQDYKMAEEYAALNYNMARKYAENSAKWNVTGLRNAGLNPILAASGGFSPSLGSSVSSPNGGASVSSSRSGSTSAGSLAEALRDVGSLQVQNNTAKQIAANTELLGAEKRNVEVNSARNTIQAINDLWSEGDSGFYRFVTKGLNKTFNHKGMFDSLKPAIQSALKVLGGSFPQENSAKSDNTPPVQTLQEHSSKRSNFKSLLVNPSTRPVGMY